MDDKDNNKREFIRKLFLFPSGRKEWCVSSDMGSLSFWATEYPEGHEQFGESHYGGIEIHYNEKSVPKYMSNRQPDHLDCHANGGKCWHDGSSLQASEYWIPDVMPLGDEYIWEKLEQEYKERFKTND